jgi:hypothetical protein
MINWRKSEKEKQKNKKKCKKKVEIVVRKEIRSISFKATRLISTLSTKL